MGISLIHSCASLIRRRGIWLFSIAHSATLTALCWRGGHITTSPGLDCLVSLHWQPLFARGDQHESPFPYRNIPRVGCMEELNRVHKGTELGQAMVSLDAGNRVKVSARINRPCRHAFHGMTRIPGRLHVNVWATCPPCTRELCINIFVYMYIIWVKIKRLVINIILSRNKASVNIEFIFDRDQRVIQPRVLRAPVHATSAL